MRNSKDWENANKIWADEFLNFAEIFISKFNNKMLTARDIKRADAYLNVFIRKGVLEIGTSNKYAMFYDFCKKVV